MGHPLRGEHVSAGNAPRARDDDPTVILPLAAGADGVRRVPLPRRELAQAPGTPAASSRPGPMPRDANRILFLALPLLQAGLHLRATRQPAELTTLRDGLERSVRDFESRMREEGVDEQTRLLASYIVCTFIDDQASSTPWGGLDWVGDSMQVRVHRDTLGGDKVFALADVFMKSPEKYIDLIELMHVCVSLGLRGRYGLVADGERSLETIRRNLHEVIRRTRAPSERSLAIAVNTLAAAPAAASATVPLWVGAAACLALLLGVFGALRWSLNVQSDPVRAQIEALRIAPTAAAVASAPARPRFAGFLAEEQARGLVRVLERADRTVISLTGDRAFAPGSATLSADSAAIVRRVAAALAERSGRVLVAGHTDSAPIRSLRFPSNWDLSRERASAVAVLLAERLEPSRLRIEGRGEASPIDSNETAEGRARNRRVEITLFASD